MSNNKRIVSIELPQELYEKLKKLSKEDDRSFSAFVRRVLESYVNGIK